MAQIGKSESLVAGFYTRKYMDEEIAITIERCAQVAEAGAFMTTQQVAAAIRKLKDENQ